MSLGIIFTSKIESSLKNKISVWIVLSKKNMKVFF